MRKWLAALAVAGVLAAMPDTASAADGCSYGPFGLVCAPGARPGVPYGYGYGYRGYDQRYRRGYGRRGGLAYYCSLGSQTPYSMRDECRRAGYW